MINSRAGVLASHATLIILYASTPVMAENCKLGRIAEFPVMVEGLQPLLTAKVNGVDARFVVDSGAFYSIISAGGAARLNLKTVPAPIGLTVTGIKGEAGVSLTTVKNLTLATLPLHDVEFLVGGTEVGQGSVGLIGQNFLHLWDVEYDLARGTVRLMKPQDCANAMLAYWAGPSTPYSVLNLSSEPPLFAQSTGTLVHRGLELSRTLSRAYVNGTEIRVLFDTGATTSVLSRTAAERAGIKLHSADVVSAGASYGIGQGTLSTYLAGISSFKIGEEEIKNTRIRIADVDMTDADMLVGADFFLSHHIYVSNAQHKLYFTYNGGPVFNLTAGTGAKDGLAAAAASTPTPATEEDAVDYARRGNALASRHEFAQALAALTRACELAPEEPDYLYERGMLYWQMQQSDAAMADLTKAISLRPEYLQAHLARARLLLQRGEVDPALVDLQAADREADKSADERLDMAHTYDQADRLNEAIGQLTLWIDAHSVDARLANALNSRCWIRALTGQDLALAMKDCNAALRLAQKPSPLYAQVSDSRGLVYLRLGEYAKAISAYDASLEINARNAWSLYGRGIARRRAQQATAGNADIAQAVAASPQVAAEFKRRGIEP